MQKIRIIGFFFENKLHWQLEAEKKICTYRHFSLHVYLHTNKSLIYNSSYVFENQGKNLRHKRCSTITGRKCLPRRAKPIRITSVRLIGVLQFLQPCVMLMNVSIYFHSEHNSWNTVQSFGICYMFRPFLVIM